VHLVDFYYKNIALSLQVVYSDSFVHI